jgi:hypothetical protein
MGFNYLQTDDRDDYLSQFKRKKTKKRLLGVDLISQNGEKIFDCVPTYTLRNYCKKNYLPTGRGGKYIWRCILIEKGYSVVNIY